MSGRMYSVPIQIAAFGTAAGDVLELVPATNILAILHGFEFGQQDSETQELFGWVLKRQATGGSGGTTVTPAPEDPGDVAASFTAESANTTDASGTTTILKPLTWNTLGQAIFWPPPSGRSKLIGGGDSLVIAIVTTPVLNADIQGFALVEEIG